MLALLVALLPLSAAFSLSGVSVPRMSDGTTVDLGAALAGGATGTTLLILGTYPADFNMIEYGQKLNHYLPALREKGVSRVLCTVNGSPSSCKLLAETIGLDTNEIELLADESGDAGRAFGVGLGWRPEDDSLNPYAKLLGMLVGLGASNTLPSVITGYLGNPGGKNGWIVDALAQGQRAGRWPQAALELDAEGRIVENAFDNLPLVGGWGRRPLELATLRLQTMVGVSLAKWDELQPTDPRCLTQLGGVIAVGGDGAVKYEWRDGGICHTCNFEELLEAL